ncbi:ParA family protein [Eubacteriales bacterium OttesenSCG-928-K08]|nr:ParA family protein [Eubacteriales bacterium OttesenSCG-928-K08]
MNKCYVLIGNFGSGKSEISINISMQAAKKEKAVLVDLDIVNPYFRSVERKGELEAAGVKLYHPIFALTTVDVPSLPPDIYSVFVGDYDTVVFDVGGDPAGATALGQYRANFAKLPEGVLEVLYVINPNRPLSSSPEQVLEMLEKIQYRSRLPVSGFINNANLAGETSADDLLLGYDMLKIISEKTGIPVSYTCGTKTVLENFAKIAKERELNDRYIGEYKEIQIYMHRDWDRFTTLGV